MRKDSKIYIAGHRGLVGSAILKKLQNEGYTNLILKTHQELDLTRQKEVEEFFKVEKPEYVFLCAAKVGGMLAQIRQRANFLYENSCMQNNVIHNAYRAGCKKLIFIASVCIYPEKAPQPIKEEYIFKGDLQINNEPYAITKIAGIKLCEYYSMQYNLDYLSLCPVSVYGANDRFDFLSSHVQAAIFRKIYLAKLFNENKESELLKDLGVKNLKEAKRELEALNITEKSIKLLGTGRPQREFLHADDLANAAFYFAKNVSFKQCLQEVDSKLTHSHINIGTTKLYSIRDLAFIIAEILEYKGIVSFEEDSLQDSTMYKLIDSSKAKRLGFEGAKIELKEGLTRMYEWYLNKAQSG